MNREAMLREMGITPLWKPRDATADAGASAVTAQAVHTPAMSPEQAPQRPRSAVAARAAEPYTGEESPPYPDDSLPPFEERPAAPAARLAPRGKPVAVAPAAPAGVDPDRVEQIARMDWPPLKEAVAGCQACGLCRTRRNTVFGVGDEQADWMIIGEAPGAEEDAKGEPFVGQAGRLLDSMLASLEMKREVNIYIANVLKCRPPGNRNPEPLEVAQCSPHLLRQVALIQPKLIILMGRFAAQTLLGTDASIASMRGRLHQYQGTPAIVTYHPAYLLRNLPDKSKAWQDLLFARRTYRGILDKAAAP